jgi:hypothetical protein
MAYLAPHLYLRANGYFGTSGGPVDYWSSGFRLSLPGASPVPDTDYTAFLESVSTAYSGFHVRPEIGAGNACFLESLSVARVGIDGKYDPSTQATTVRPFGPVVGGGGTTSMEWSRAWVCSLRTGIARGLASNGRAYWPCTALVINGATGRLLPTQVTAALERWKILIDSINSAADSVAANLRVSVLSQGGVSGGPARRVVTQLRMDARLDRQERREDDTPSEYLTTNLA